MTASRRDGRKALEGQPEADGHDPTGHGVPTIDRETEIRQLVKRTAGKARASQEQTAVARALLGRLVRDGSGERTERIPAIPRSHVRQPAEKQQCCVTRGDLIEIRELTLNERLNIDLRALAPLKLEAIEASLARTGRLIVLHEGRRTHGFGAELVALLTESHFAVLKSAPLRIASLDLPVPFAPELEQAFRPTKDKVIEQITAWMG
jgi:hypothetical protein